MNRNVYDTDCVTWSPQGRIFQIEYASEAVKQGSCVVGVRSATHAVLCSLRRSVSKLADYNSKILKVDEHIGVTFSGITADANLIVRGLRSQCLNHKFTFDTPSPIERLLTKLSQQSQQNTQNYGKRPFGVGLLVAGFDGTGPHIFETTPSGEYIEYIATAFGSRYQAAKTFLEAKADDFINAEADALIDLAMQALASTVPTDFELTGQALHVAIIGKDCPIRFVDTQDLDERVARLNLAHRVEA